MEAGASVFRMNTAARIIGILFGIMMTTLSLIVAAETIIRKLFNASLQGADELGGYALAVGSSLAFSVALVRRAHIRIELLHVRLSAGVQAVLNWAAMLLLALFGLLLTYVCWTILTDTLAYRSTAPTPWATPLIWPQSLWYAGLVLFTLLALGLATRATILLVSGRFGQLNRDYGPVEVREELAHEIEDLKRR